MSNATESVTLYYKSGNSDKVYQAGIESAGEGLFIVNFAYGRRGSTLKTGSKTEKPVSYEQAKKVFDKLVKGKMAKGYSPGEGGTPYVGTENENRDSGVRCQLLNAVDEDEIERLIEDPDFYMQEKFDGRRMLVRKRDGEVTGINRRGLEVGLPETIAADAALIEGDFIIDGEAVGDTLHAFDVLEHDCINAREHPYRGRFGRLTLILARAQTRHIRAVNMTVQPAEKRAMLERLREEGCEGVVFKQKDATYSPGRPNSGGDQLKFKFQKTASCVVWDRNANRRSVSLVLFENGLRIECGNVAIPPNQIVPLKGSVVEVRYLYAMPQSHALYQPVYLGRSPGHPIRGMPAGSA